MSNWQERLDWNLTETKKLRIINDKNAEARLKKLEEAKKALVAKGIDPNLLTTLPSTISQTKARKMEKHDLDLGDICQVTAGKFADKKVLVIKAGITTKFGLKTITVEYFASGRTGEKIWVGPEQLKFEGEADMETANAIKEADYQEWKSRKQAGVPPASAFKSQKPWQKKPEVQTDGEDSFL